MAVSKAQKAATAKYESKVYDKILLRLPKGKKLVIELAAKRTGESVNGFIADAIESKMTGTPADGAPAPLSLLSPEGLQTAQTAATAAGEELPVFVERAVNAQAERDKRQKLFDCMTPKTE